MSDLTIHVLVVDDDPSVRQMMADYLGDYDITVSAVATGREMNEVLAREAIDLLILDLRLPGEDGLQIARQLREQSELAIIVITGRKEEADRVMALELGADDYLTKPFSPRELLARIRALLRRTRAHRDAAGAKVRIYRSAGWVLKVGAAPAHDAERRRSGVVDRRVQPAERVSRVAAAGAFARPVARPLKAAQRRGL
jgi:two-component system, OmpR family, response regulator